MRWRIAWSRQAHLDRQLVYPHQQADPVGRFACHSMGNYGKPDPHTGSGFLCFLQAPAAPARSRAWLANGKLGGMDCVPWTTHAFVARTVIQRDAIAASGPS